LLSFFVISLLLHPALQAGCYALLALFVYTLLPGPLDTGQEDIEVDADKVDREDLLYVLGRLHGKASGPGVDDHLALWQGPILAHDLGRPEDDHQPYIGHGSEHFPHRSPGVYQLAGWHLFCYGLGPLGIPRGPGGYLAPGFLELGVFVFTLGVVWRRGLGFLGSVGGSWLRGRV